MFIIEQTDVFRQWRANIKDERLLFAVAGRIDRLSFGLLGDAKPLSGGVSELRIHYGAGYRLYFQRRDKEVILLLCGGEKSTQQRDIKRAQKIAKEWRDENG